MRRRRRAARPRSASPEGQRGRAAHRKGRADGSRSITPQLLDVYAAMQAIVNKTFKEIAVGDCGGSVQRTLQAGDVPGPGPPPSAKMG